MLAFLELGPDSPNVDLLIAKLSNPTIAQSRRIEPTAILGAGLARRSSRVATAKAL